MLSPKNGLIHTRSSLFLKQKSSIMTTLQQMSVWAKRNPRKSQISIVFLKTILNLSALYLGFWLYVEGARIGSIFLPFGIFLFAIGWRLYPHKQPKTFQNFRHRKLCEGLVLNAVFILTVAFGNIGSAWVNAPVGSDSEFRTALTASKKPLLKSGKKARKSFKKDFRKKAKILFQKAKDFKKKQSTSDAAGEIVGIIFLALLAEVLILYLSCAIACSGGGIAGFLFLIMATILLIQGVVKWIKKVKEKADTETSG